MMLQLLAFIFMAPCSSHPSFFFSFLMLFSKKGGGNYSGPIFSYLSLSAKSKEMHSRLRLPRST